MIVIEEIHLNEAIRIVQEFHQLRNGLTSYENYIETLKQSILKMKNQIDDLIKDSCPELKKQADLYELISNHEVEINTEAKKIEPLLKEIEQLKADSFKLYHILKDKYPGATDVQLKEALDSKIEQRIKMEPSILQ